MTNYCKINMIPIILNKFKVNKLIICGLPDENVLNQILKYCDNKSISYIIIDQNKYYPLKKLRNLNNYDAIFLNDDPNWYTVYNELTIINQNNEEFPLVFIINNIFPHKRRDSYMNPKIIPKEFVNSYSKVLNYNGITINDNYYHAIKENTSKNGVLTAIEDFLNEHELIEMMNFKLGKGITVLYPKNSISQIRLGVLSTEMEKYIIDYDDLPDKILENQLLTNHISKFKILNEEINIIEEFEDEIKEKEKTIKEYENKIKLHEDEFNYKNSQIENIESKLNLKESQIKNIESKLCNHENKINNLNNKLNKANKQIKDNINQLNLKNQELADKDIQIKDNINQLNLKNQEINDNNTLIKITENELKNKNYIITLIKQQYTNQISKLENKNYCINCYKEEISNNHLEIEYLKNNSFIKKLFNPVAYLYLILKSNPKELFLNFKLYKTIKNSKCFDIGFYLNNNKDIIESKWCKYFSPELHYVCNGFEESRKFNKKYFNRSSKKELLEYILNCD